MGRLGQMKPINSRRHHNAPGRNPRPPVASRTASSKPPSLEPEDLPEVEDTVKTIRPDNIVPERLPTQTFIDHGYLPLDHKGRPFNPPKRAKGRYDHRKRK